MAYGLASQAVLLVFFAARRWRRPLADRFGWMAYGFGILGGAVGVALIVSGAPWRLWCGPLIFAAWAVYGAWADLWRRVEWRQRPVDWRVLGPYLTLYLAGQMFLWWPLWDYRRAGWIVYLVLFVANTALNLWGHLGEGARLSPA